MADGKWKEFSQLANDVREFINEYAEIALDDDAWNKEGLKAISDIYLVIGARPIVKSRRIGLLRRIVRRFMK